MVRLKSSSSQEDSRSSLCSVYVDDRALLRHPAARRRIVFFFRDVSKLASFAQYQDEALFFLKKTRLVKDKGPFGNTIAEGAALSSSAVSMWNKSASSGNRRRATPVTPGPILSEKTKVLRMS